MRLTLLSRFPASWVAQNHRDLLSQAIAEYAEWLRDNPPAQSPTGWLVQRARWRALTLIARENRRSGPPLDSVIHTAEDPAPTPEEALLQSARTRRIETAISHIPEKERKLLALVYDEGRSITAAGRLLGWGKTSASAHHTKAMERLRAMVGPRDFL